MRELAHRGGVIAVVVGLVVAVLLSGCSSAEVADGAIQGRLLAVSPMLGQGVVGSPIRIDYRADHGASVQKTFKTGVFRLKVSPGRYTVRVAAMYSYSHDVGSFVKGVCPASGSVRVRPGAVSKLVLKCPSQGFEAG